MGAQWVMTAGDDDWPAVCTEELGAAVTDFEQGRGRQESIGKFIQDGGTGSPNVRGRDMGADPKDRAGAGYLHARGRAQYHWEPAVESGGGVVNGPILI